MKTRILAAAALLPVLFVVIWVLPKFFTAILFGVIGVIGAYELLYGAGFVKQPRPIGYAMAMAVFVALWSGLWHETNVAKLGIAVFACLLFGELLWTQTKLPFESIAITFLAGAVIPFLLCAPARIQSWADGRYVVLLPFAIAFLSDTGAYFIGCAFGKHKLAPIISPKKTVEGLIGGVLFAILGVIGYCLVLQYAFDFRVNYLYVPVYGIVGSLGAVFGDLSFSAIKRQTGIKDYGNLIPGHGGVLDRFDSMTVAAPLTELLMLYIPLVVK